MPKKTKYYSSRRRAVYAQGENIYAVDIFERDGWVCQLCEVPINRYLRYPAWWSATLDHILPISRGGLHTSDNVRTAHRRCNELRGNELDCLQTIPNVY